MKTLKVIPMKAALQGALAASLLAGAPAALAGAAYDLGFQGDASFQGAHGGQAIEAAVVHADSGEVVARDAGTVSKSDDPSFAFTFSGALKDGESYEVHYWIDSNFGGGSAGTCDPQSNDHQWSVALGSVDGDVTHTEDHAPGEMSGVCDTFG